MQPLLALWPVTSRGGGNFGVGMWTEPILHVDMDAFFVEVERLRDPSLVGKAVAVGGAGKRGVIASASYEARAHGVRSAQPTTTALLVCRDLVVVPPSHERYGEMSSRVFEVFREFTPYVEGLSLDEAFLDVSGLRRHFATAVEVAVAVRSEIRGQIGLPASVGIAASKFMAKIASESAKPDGYRHIPKDTELEFLHALPVEALWGVGPATLAGLQRLGVVTIGDLAELPEPTVLGSLGPTQGRHLLDLARGIDHRPVTPDTEAKSISVEETYDRDLQGRDLIETALLAHAQRLAVRLHRSGLAARTVTLKVRYDDFTTVTRSVTPGGAVDSPRDLYARARDLLGTVDLDRPVRLLGLGGSSLEAAKDPRQLLIDSDESWAAVTEAVAEVRERFGEHSVEPARLLGGVLPDEESDR
ncbi:MAG: DNA polymerase IV [Acidimicrobiia bacterium]